MANTDLGGFSTHDSDDVGFELQSAPAGQQPVIQVTSRSGAAGVAPSFKDSSGNPLSLGGRSVRNSLAAALAAFSTVETILAQVALLPGVTIDVGTILRIVIEGTCTSGGADNVTFNLRAGTLGTTSDAVAATVLVAAAGSGSGQAFKATLEFTVRTIGATGTLYGDLAIVNVGTTGIVASASKLVVTTPSATAFSTATFLEICAVTAASSTTLTIQRATLEVIPQ